MSAPKSLCGICNGPDEVRARTPTGSSLKLKWVGHACMLFDPDSNSRCLLPDGHVETLCSNGCQECTNAGRSARFKGVVERARRVLPCRSCGIALCVIGDSECAGPCEPLGWGDTVGGRKHDDEGEEVAERDWQHVCAVHRSSEA